MKIAVVGKGGSGKSSISWLLSNYLAKDANQQTLAIDSDHNMDLATNLGIEPSNVNHFKDFNKKFRQLSGMPEKGMWKEYFNHPQLEFNYPKDSKISEYITKINEKLDIIVVGLGDEQVMENIICSHGLSAPIKYMIPTLKLEKDTWVVLDSVAGSDMINYGLYFGFDVLICVVESHTNSLKVANQLQYLLKKQGLTLHFIVNKFDSETLDDYPDFKNFIETNKDLILGYLPLDIEIIKYKYDKISDQTKKELQNIIKKIKGISPMENSYNKLKTFELAKN
jgi:CO dehydrogenase maturation factor